MYLHNIIHKMKGNWILYPIITINLFPANAILVVRKEVDLYWAVDTSKARFWCVLTAEGEKYGLLWQNDRVSRIWKMCMQSTGQFTLFMIRQDIQLSNVCEHFPLFVKSTYSFSQFVQICPQLELCARIEGELWRRKKNVAFFEWRNECLKCFTRVLIEVYFDFSYTQRGIDISAVFWCEYLFNPASNRPLTGQSGRRKPSAICWYVHCWTAIKHVDAQKVFFHDVYTRHGAGKRLNYIKQDIWNTLYSRFVKKYVGLYQLKLNPRNHT